MKEFHADAVTVTPALMTLLTARFSAEEYARPNDIFATAGSTRLAASQSSPAITPLVVPIALQSRTCTESRFGPFADP